MVIRLYNVIGMDDLEGSIFVRCTSLEKAEAAKRKIEKEGHEDMLDIVQDEILVDAIEIDGELIEL